MTKREGPVAAAHKSALSSVAKKLVPRHVCISVKVTTVIYVWTY